MGNGVFFFFFFKAEVHKESKAYKYPWFQNQFVLERIMSPDMSARDIKRILDGRLFSYMSHGSLLNQSTLLIPPHVHLCTYGHSAE